MMHYEQDLERTNNSMFIYRQHSSRTKIDNIKQLHKRGIVELSIQLAEQKYFFQFFFLFPNSFRMSWAVMELWSLYSSVISNAFLILKSVQQINDDIRKPKIDNAISRFSLYFMWIASSKKIATSILRKRVKNKMKQLNLA